MIPQYGRLTSLKTDSLELGKYSMDKKAKKGMGIRIMADFRVVEGVSKV